MRLLQPPLPESVPTFLQTVRAIGGFLARAAAHCAERGSDPDDFVHARLFETKWDAAGETVRRALQALACNSTTCLEFYIT